MAILEKILISLFNLVVIFVLIFLFAKFGPPLPFDVNSTNTTKIDSFTVSGEGKVITKPDIANITLGIESEGVDVKVVQANINSVINKVSESIKGLGIKDEDIQTQNYSIYPNYDYTKTTQKITGFRGSTSLFVKVSDLDKINSVIDTAVESGVNQISGIEFDVGEKEKYMDQARKKAVEEAKKKAEDSAKAAGFRLGKIVNYSESFNSEIRPPFYQGLSMAMPEKADTKIEPGSEEVVLTVSLSFEIY